MLLAAEPASALPESSLHARFELVNMGSVGLFYRIGGRPPQRPGMAKQA